MGATHFHLPAPSAMPPETFTFAGMFAHVITFNAHQRLLALDALRRLGLEVDGSGCPTEYESSVALTR